MEKTINFEGDILTLVIVEGPSSNWDIYYCDRNKQLYYISKKKGCRSGWFGDLLHLRRLKNRFGYSYEMITKKGYEIGIGKILEG